jgi:hypothetical protein
MRDAPKTRAVARNLWVAGSKTESQIAKAVGTSLRNIVRWRDRENWQELKMLVEARAAAMTGDRAATAEERQLKLADAIEGLIIKILNKGSEALDARAIKMLMSAIKDSQDVRLAVHLRRIDRAYRQEEALERARRQRERERP